MEHKKYRDIERLKENNSDTFKPGDHIIITEKVDGSNATIGYDNGIVAMSRNRILTFDNTNRGFYEFANRLDAEKVNKLLGSRYLLSGEWVNLIKKDFGKLAGKISMTYARSFIT